MQSISGSDEAICRIIQEISFQHSLLSLGAALDAARTGTPGLPDNDSASAVAALRRSLAVMPPGEAHAELPR
jgi:hypothetical protein